MRKQNEVKRKQAEENKTYLRAAIAIRTECLKKNKQKK